MRKLFILGIALTSGFHLVAQSINFERDTVQILQNSDAGNVAAADIDNDGDIDILISGTPPVTTTLYLNDGFGSFTSSPQSAIINVYAGASGFADVNNDGHVDLLITGNTSSPTATASLYMNDGAGNYSMHANASISPSYSGDFDFGDVDGDGDQDLFITGKDEFDTPFARLYLNNGSGTFSASTTSFPGVWKSSCKFLDIDNDGDLDLIYSGSKSNSTDLLTDLYLNDGLGHYNLSTSSSFTDVEFGKIAFADTDQDGDQDILITGYDVTQAIADLYINQGGTFTLAQNTPFPGAALHSSSFADFDLDGYPELLHIGNAATGLIAEVYKNNGNNQFVLDNTSLAGSYNGNHIAADLNGDGLLDIVVTGTSFTMPARAPKIYYNTTTTIGYPEQALHAEKFQIFPNPSVGILNIQSDWNEPTSVHISDLSGKVLYNGDFNSSNFTLEVNLTPGIYLLHLNSQANKQVEKIQIQ